MDSGELILYAIPDPVHAARSAQVFADLGMRGRPVAPGEVTQTVGYLAGLPGQMATPRPLVSPTLAQPIMVLCNLSRPRMDVLFQAMRAANCPPPDRKAVLTPTNRNWPLSDLYAELGREHEELHGRKPE